MKIATLYRCELNRRPAVRYPNAATRREALHKLLDQLLIGAMCVAAVAILLFLLTLA